MNPGSYPGKLRKVRLAGKKLSGETKHHILIVAGIPGGQEGSYKYKKRTLKENTMQTYICNAAKLMVFVQNEVAGSIPGLTQWVKGPALLWLWRRSAAVAPIKSLAWEHPYYM